MTKVKFCEDIGDDLLNRVIPLFLDLDKKEILKLYQFFISAFEDFEQYRLLTDEEIESVVIFPKNKVNNIYPWSDKTHHLGVDLPVWLSRNGNKKKVLICAMDPLRSNRREGKVDIWTPFSVSTFMADSNQRVVKTYWPFISKLLTEVDVYLTDIFKVYYLRDLENGKTRKSNKDKEFKRGDLLEHHGNVIKAEVNLYKPDIIITLGEEALKNLNEIKGELGGIPIVSLPHLSYAAGGAKKEFILSHNYNYEPRSTAETIAEIVLNKYI